METRKPASTENASTHKLKGHYYEIEGDGHDARILDLEIQKRLIASAQELLIQLYTLVRTLIVHQQENEAAQNNLNRLHKAIQEIFEHEHEIHIEFTGTDFLINERWSQLARRFPDVCLGLGKVLGEREIGGIWISAIPQKVQLLDFVNRLSAIDPSKMKEPFSLLQTQLWRRRFDWISIEKYVDFEDWDDQQVAPRDTIRQTYFQAIQVIQQLQLQVEQDRPLKLKTAKRVIQALIDLFDNPRYLEEIDLLLQLTQIKNSLEYRYSHPVNVAVLSIGFGHALGLPRTLRRDLGIAALLYDTGMMKLPENLTAVSNLSPQDRELLERHPILAIPLILHTSIIDSTVLRSVNVSFAHHLGAQDGGYPKFGQGLTSLTSQIIAIADFYDARSTPQPYREKILTPPEALASLARVPERFLVPALVRQFVSWISPIPIGTIVRLQENSIGYVFRRSMDPRFRDRPVVKVIQSQHCPPGSFIDLNQRAPGGQFYWQIVEVLRSDREDLQGLYLVDILR